LTSFVFPFPSDGELNLPSEHDLATQETAQVRLFQRQFEFDLRTRPTMPTSTAPARFQRPFNNTHADMLASKARELENRPTNVFLVYRDQKFTTTLVRKWRSEHVDEQGRCTIDVDDKLLEGLPPPFPVGGQHQVFANRVNATTPGLPAVFRSRIFYKCILCPADEEYDKLLSNLAVLLNAQTMILMRHDFAACTIQMRALLEQAANGGSLMDIPNKKIAEIKRTFAPLFKATKIQAMLAMIRIGPVPWSWLKKILNGESIAKAANKDYQRGSRKGQAKKSVKPLKINGQGGFTDMGQIDDETLAYLLKQLFEGIISLVQFSDKCKNAKKLIATKVATVNILAERNKFQRQIAMINKGKKPNFPEGEELTWKDVVADFPSIADIDFISELSNAEYHGITRIMKHEVSDSFVKDVLKQLKVSLATNVAQVKASFFSSKRFKF
jgi:hypothetical protein